MQLLTGPLCTVEITEDTTYTVDSADNRPYDRVLNPQGYRRNDFTRAFSIRIRLPERTLTLALIGTGYAHAHDCAILEGDELLVLQNHDLTRLRIRDGEIIRSIRMDRIGFLKSIYPMPGGYLVVGELEVFRMDASLQVLWSYGARDVFRWWQMKEDHLLLWEEHGMQPERRDVRLGFDGKPLP